MILVGGGFYRLGVAGRGASDDQHGHADLDGRHCGVRVLDWSCCLSKLFFEALDGARICTFGEAAALLGIISLGHWLESRATAKRRFRRARTARAAAG
jgi:cation transport ATPase